MRLLPLPAFVALALLAAGCSSSPRATPQYFLLDPGKPTSMKALRTAAAGTTASVSFVDVAAPFAADGFVYQVGDGTWETDPYNQFLVSPAEMVTSLVRNWTRDSGLYGDVAMPGAGGTQQYVIDCDVTELYGDFRNPSAPEAVLSLEVQVFRNSEKGRILVLQKTFTNREPVAERTPAALIAAWNEALRLQLNALLRALASDAR